MTAFERDLAARLFTPAGHVKLQGIRQPVPAVKSGELRPGDVTLWNYGYTEIVRAVTPSKSGKSVVVEFMTDNGTDIGSRTFRADRLVAIQQRAPEAAREVPEATPAETAAPETETILKEDKPMNNTINLNQEETARIRRVLLEYRSMKETDDYSPDPVGAMKEAAALLDLLEAREAAPAPAPETVRPAAARAFSFPVSGGQMYLLEQEKHDAPVVARIVGEGKETRYSIPAGEFVQLLNLYRYVKRFNLQDDFINPDGTGIVNDDDAVEATETLEAVHADFDDDRPIEKNGCTLWTALGQDGDGGYHFFQRYITRKAAPGTDPAGAFEQEVAAMMQAAGGNIVAAWPECQVVERP